MSQSLNESHFFLLFQLFETVTLKWDYRKIKVSKNPEDSYQKVCKYLRLL